MTTAIACPPLCANCWRVDTSDQAVVASNPLVGSSNNRSEGLTTKNSTRILQRAFDGQNITKKSKLPSETTNRQPRSDMRGLT